MAVAGPGAIHVIPVGDLIDHDTSGEECICGPDAELIDTGVWLISHHSLDGRELGEPDHEDES